MNEHTHQKIALSFVQTSDDISQLRSLMEQHPAKIIAKIEKPSGVSNIEEITEACDAIMVTICEVSLSLSLFFFISFHFVAPTHPSLI
jgi:pyruvate kinase